MGNERTSSCRVSRTKRGQVAANERMSSCRVTTRERGQATADEEQTGCMLSHHRRERPGYSRWGTDWLHAESPQEREARLQQMRDRLAAESPQEREARLQQMRDRLAAESPQERGQATADEGQTGCWVTTRERPGYSRWGTEWLLSHQKREARLHQMRDRLAAESPEERGQATSDEGQTGCWVTTRERGQATADEGQAGDWITRRERLQATEYDHSPKAFETFEEREVRLQRATGCANREQSLFKQHFVKAISFASFLSTSHAQARPK